MPFFIDIHGDDLEFRFTQSRRESSPTITKFKIQQP